MIRNLAIVGTTLGLLTALILSSGLKVARADANCDARLRQVSEAQAAQDFPGRKIVIEAAPTTDHGNVHLACVLFRDADTSKVLAIYTTLIDEVCELNDGFTLQPSFTNCPGAN